MKKLMMILAVVLLATACEGPPGPPGPMGPAGGGNKVSIPITIESSHWVRYPDKGPFLYYFYKMEMPELTYYVLTGGLYSTYLSINDNNILVQEGLGATIYHEEADGTLWEETVSCDYSENCITFYVKNSRFYESRPNTLQFRFAAMW